MNAFGKVLLNLVAAQALAVSAHANDGALDAAFGDGGAARLAQAGDYHGTWMPTDVALQSNGKIIISGWDDRNGTNNCFVLRLNSDGGLDTTFGGGNGYPGGYAGFGYCRYMSVAVRGDDSIVVGGYGVGYTITPGFIGQFTADGAPDQNFGSTGTLFLEPSLLLNDLAVEINHIALDGSGNVIAGGAYTEANGSTDFYIARASANGNSSTYAIHSFPGASTYADIAYDIEIARDGSFCLAGTATSSAGDVDCAVAHYYYNSGFDALLGDATFGNPATTDLVLARNYGGDNNDYCFALALQPPLDTFVLAGQSTAVYNITWQAATATTQGSSGYPKGRTDLTFWWDQASTPVASQVDTVRRVLIEPYDKRPLLIGSGPNHSSFPPSAYDIGILRLYSANTFDASFGSGGFALYDVGSFPDPNDNTATSAVFDNGGGLIVVGTADDALGGTDIVALRLAPFDGIFRNGFDPAININ